MWDTVSDVSGLKQSQGTEQQSVAIHIPPISSFQNFLSSACPSRSKDELSVYCIPHVGDIFSPRFGHSGCDTSIQPYVTTWPLSYARTDIEVTHRDTVP